jgi:hypothetical protein
MSAGYDRQVRDTKLFRTPEWRNHTEGGLLGFFEKYGRKKEVLASELSIINE